MIEEIGMHAMKRERKRERHVARSAVTNNREICRVGISIGFTPMKRETCLLR